MEQTQQSEIAYLKRQMALEHEAGREALYGLSQGTATHAFINNKMERMAVFFARLVLVAGEEAAQEALKKI